MRTSRIERTTKESSITVEINLDGTGDTDIATGLPFFDPMLTAFGSHGCFALTVHADGDIDLDAHH
ncbi:MAG: imidazoleglycerol-phosphate dehydratase, partial [Corynebacterium glyciniphilum]|nr:imidazoleglycerol-phosphate dehydratase [Corynebacterium glyciniphilum]